MNQATNRELKPKLRFPEFRDAGEWDRDALDDLLEIIDGDRGSNYPKSDEFSSSGYCVFLNAKNVTKNGFKFDEIQFITKEKDEVLRKGKLQRQDVVLTTRGSVGQFALYSEDVLYDNIRINSGMVVLRIKSRKINADYLYVFCRSQVLATYIENIAFGNAQQQLTVAEIKKFQLLYPQLKEQQKIADCLSSIDDRITAETQKLDTLKAHKKGLMQQLFPAEGETRPKLRFPEFCDAGEWEEKTIGNLLTIGNGKDYKHLSKGEIPVYGTGGYMLSVNDYLYNGESVCIGRKGTIDKPVLLSGKFWTVDTLFYTHSFKDCLPKFIYLCFQNINWLDYNAASGVPSLSKATIENIEILVPSVPEQQKIANCLSSLDELIAAQSQAINLLKLHKKGLMQQLFPCQENEK